MEIADAQRVKGLAPLACKTDKIDAKVLAELFRRDLVPAIWLPTPSTRRERERARFRLHLVHHRVALKNRIHAMLLTFGRPCLLSDLFGESGRELLKRIALPEPWAGTVAASLRLIDHLDREIDACKRDLRALGADHPYVALLQSVPGIGSILAYTIASEIADISPFSTAKNFVDYTGLCPRVYRSGGVDRRGRIAKNGPTYLRWALIEASIHACHHPLYQPAYDRTKARLGRSRGGEIARIELGRQLTESIWHMLTEGECFAPARSQACALVA